MDSTPAEQPWFREGLRFECTQCGKCCTGDPGFVWVNDEEIDKLAKFRGDKRHEFAAVYTRAARGNVTLREKANGDCVFFEAGRGCTVYPVRPRQCRTWPFWGEQRRIARGVGAHRGELPRLRAGADHPR